MTQGRRGSSCCRQTQLPTVVASSYELLALCSGAAHKDSGEHRARPQAFAPLPALARGPSSLSIGPSWPVLPWGSGTGPVRGAEIREGSCVTVLALQGRMWVTELSLWAVSSGLSWLLSGSCLVQTELFLILCPVYNRLPLRCSPLCLCKCTPWG